MVNTTDFGSVIFGSSPDEGAMKRCNKCDRTLPFSEFHKSTSKGYQGYCKECNLAYNKSYHSKARRRRVRHKLHGLTEEEFEDLKVMQWFKCAICKEDLPEPPNIDHDHRCCPGSLSCGSCVRGLLCQRCNWLVGAIESNLLLVPIVFTYIDSRPL